MVSILVSLQMSFFSAKVSFALLLYGLDSSQGILACRSGTHETKKNTLFFKYFVHVLCMYLSSKHAEMHSNSNLLPFY
jgi:hypothetical protein